jgi:uncharacterized protein YcfL
MCRDTIIEYNTVSGSGTVDTTVGEGIKVGSGDYASVWNDNNTVRYSRVYGNKNNGMAFHQDGNFKAHHNLIYSNTLGLNLSTSSNNTIYNNTKQNVVIETQGVDNVTIKNNLFVESTARDHAIYVYANSNGRFISDYNIVYGLDYWANRAGVTNSLADWRTNTGQDANSQVVDPLFVSTVTPDFHLQTGSPAINAGVDVGIVLDYAGSAIVGLPDIGAYEYQGGLNRIPNFPSFRSFPTFR